MRTVVVVALIVALGGCYSIRHRNDAESAGAVPAKASRKPAKEVLPGGLGGDKANHSYTATP